MVLNTQNHTCSKSTMDYLKRCKLKVLPWSSQSSRFKMADPNCQTSERTQNFFCCHFLLIYRHLFFLHSKTGKQCQISWNIWKNILASISTESVPGQQKRHKSSQTQVHSKQQSPCTTPSMSQKPPCCTEVSDSSPQKINFMYLTPKSQSSKYCTGTFRHYAKVWNSGANRHFHQGKQIRTTVNMLTTQLTSVQLPCHNWWQL